MPYTLQIGESAKPFNLLGTDGKQYTLDAFRESDYLVIFFTCNHCPYVIGSNESTARVAEKYRSFGVRFVGINSNSPNTYPEDSYEKMCETMDKHKYPWVYLYDKTQQVALDYGALCTPHFFLFDPSRKLLYTGRAVNSPRDPARVTVNDLDNALASVTSGEEIQVKVTNPIGCNIKWEGKDKHFMPPEACDLI